jgi:CubicO group peptidase (beta-lactamase class C family)
MQDAMHDIGTWRRFPSPAAAGWSGDKLAAAKAYADSIDTEAVMIVARGRVVAAWGKVAADYNVHSIRKSLLSALFGIHEAEGRVDLEATLATLGIDDKEGLTEREKLATVLDLLTARSGVYHPSGYESPWMVSIKPARGSAGPGTTWCYNNWDFNALGTIFRRLTGADIFADFSQRIAIPCEMEDFRPGEHGQYVELPASDHPAYPFRLTARDMARFGELFLRHGRWNGRQVVPADWVAASVLPYSDAGVGGAYGYMWWVAREGIFFPGVIVPDGTYAALGAGGHKIVVIPALETIVVHRVDTDQPAKLVSNLQFGRLLRLILAASGG